MAKMMDKREYPKTLSAPVDEDTWTWWRAQAKAEFRTPGAHLRWLILKHRADLDSRLKVAESFGTAVSGSIPVRRDSVPLDQMTPVSWLDPEPIDEGMT